MNAQVDAEMLGDVWVRPLLEGRNYPLLICPRRGDVDLAGWAREQRAAIDRLICETGALLFRGFQMPRLEAFEAVVDAVSPSDWVSYREAATPRSHVSGHLFTATEYPPELRIYVHNENSHVTTWPLYLFFHCRTPAREGGHTPLADCRGVLQRLPPNVVGSFLERGWLYRRNFSASSSVPWQKTFGTNSREVVEQYCRTNHMTAEWTKSGLTVRYRRWSALRHPRTQDMVWFNHGTFFNRHTLEPAVRGMFDGVAEEALPYNSYYGDGSSVEPETMRLLDEAYAAETVSFPWMRGDVLMVDNMRLAHGRLPYRGEREVVVAMKWKVSCYDIAGRDTYAAPE